jgi:hypothetical protein
MIFAGLLILDALMVDPALTFGCLFGLYAAVVLSSLSRGRL